MSKHAYQTKRKNTSVLKYSPSFRKFLESIRENCRVARCLLEASEFNRYHANPLPVNYISYRDAEGLISYMPSNREQLFNENGTWSTAGRQTTRPVKFARTVLHPRLVKRIKDHEFAEFNAKFRANELQKEIQFKITDFKDAYQKKNYSVDIYSCMANKPVDRFYNMFDCAVVVAVRNNTYIGRAIIWNEVFLNDGAEPIKVMDRIYTGDKAEIVQLFKEWATDNGYYRKLNQNSYNTDSIVSPLGDTVENPTLKIVKKKKAKSKLYRPYMDTMEYTSHNYEVLTNKFRAVESAYYNLKSAENYREDKGEYIIAYIDNNGTVDVVRKEDVVKFKGKLYSLLSRTCCYVNNRYYHKSDPRIIYDVLRNRYYLKETHVLMDGKVYDKTDNSIRKAGNNRWVLKKDIQPIQDAIVDTNKGTPSSETLSWGERVTDALDNWIYPVTPLDDYMRYIIGGNVVARPTNGELFDPLPLTNNP